LKIALNYRKLYNEEREGSDARRTGLFLAVIIKKLKLAVVQISVMPGEKAHVKINCEV